MKIYFLSSRTCALTLNGAFFGITNDFERFAEISLKDNFFVCFSPENATPVSFFLTENIRFQPPTGCDVYLLKDGIALYAHGFHPLDCTLRAIAQIREQDCVATVFQQGEIQLSLQSQKGFFVAPLPSCFSECELQFQNGLLFIRAPQTLAVFTQSGKRLFLEQILSHEIENGVLKVVLPLSDSLGRVAECSYALEENACVRQSFILKQSRTREGCTKENAIREELIAFAFFESVLLGLEYAEMLAPCLRERAHELPSFLGAFSAVTVTDDPRVCGLVRRKGEGLFEVAYFRVETENGKITDIKN